MASMKASGEGSEEDSAEAAMDCHIRIGQFHKPQLGPAIGGVDLV